MSHLSKEENRVADRTVNGKKAGVSQEILDFLAAVAKYSGNDIEIKDGKRTASGQAQRMYKNWTGTVDRGNVYVAGGSLTESDRVELDRYWDTAHDSKASADSKKKAETEFRKLAAKTPSKHVAGLAVDLVESDLTGPMKKVIVKYMKQVPEKGCFHVQYKGKLPSEEIIKKERGVKE